MADRIKIPDEEYAQRLKKAAAMTAKKGLDVLIVNSNDSDYANVRYFSGFWPLFETAGVAITPSGKAALMVGPVLSHRGRDSDAVRSHVTLPTGLTGGPWQPT